MSEDGTNIFGDWLKEELKKQRMTQTELALQIESEGGFISRIVNGKLKPSWTTMQKILWAMHSKIMIVPEETERLVPELDALPAEMEGGGSCWWYVCQDCHGDISLNDHYCRHCGRKVSWK